MAANDDFARAIYHLIGWGEWRRRNKGWVAVGYPNKSAGFETGGASEEFDTIAEREDRKAAVICDAIIEDRKFFDDRYRTIIQSKYIMQGTFKSNRHRDIDLLAEAQMAFWRKARKFLT